MHLKIWMQSELPNISAGQLLGRHGQRNGWASRWVRLPAYYPLILHLVGLSRWSHLWLWMVRRRKFVNQLGRISSAAYIQWMLVLKPQHQYDFAAVKVRDGHRWFEKYKAENPRLSMWWPCSTNMGVHIRGDLTLTRWVPVRYGTRHQWFPVIVSKQGPIMSCSCYRRKRIQIEYNVLYEHLES